jgi:hypothetical protein
LATGYLSEYDGSLAITQMYSGFVPIVCAVERGYTGAAASNGFCGGLPSQQFAMATSLETSNGIEISGLNAEEQVIYNLTLV